MTRCPYCQTPIPRDAPECVSCRLTFPRTNSLVGALPRLNTVVGDTTGQLRRAEINRLKREVTRLQNQYPQLIVQLVMHSFPNEHPFSMYAFWLFNAGAFAGETNKGPANYCLVVVVDPVRCEAGIVPGYGLESFMSEDATGHILEMAGPAFESGKWETGFELILEGISELLKVGSVTEDLNQGVGTEF